MKISATPLHLGLNLPVSHASHSRTRGDSVFVVAELDDHIGLGEGCPRGWVTGETTESCLSWIGSLSADLEGIRTLGQLRALVDRRATDIDAHPAAWCAVELAMIDLLARAEGVSAETWLGVAPAHEAIAYTAVLFEVPDPLFEALAARHAAYGFDAWKFRVSGDLTTDLWRLETLAGLGARSIRVDANNLFTDGPDLAVRHFQTLHGRHVLAAIEEPVAVGDASTHSILSESLAVPVVLDESVVRASDFQRYDGLGGTFVVNVKLSKSGGLLRAMRLIDEARQRGWRVLLGANVGETSILTRASTVLSTHAEPVIMGHEGAYGTLLLEREIVSPELRFGRGGRLDLTSLSLGPTGFGLHPISPVNP